MLNIFIQQQDPRYSRKVKKVQAFCKKIIQSAWFEKEPSEVSLVLSDDETVHQLNLQYRQKDSATNVLSFENAVHPPKGQVWLAGDIILAYETLLREAKDQNKTFEAHLAHLLIHGALHLQGYDHIKESQAKKMEALETKIMIKLGYEDPYKDVC